MIDVELKRHAYRDLAFLDDALMHDDVAELLLSRFDAKSNPLCAQFAYIANLTARFAVEGRLVDDDRPTLARLKPVVLHAAAQKRGHDALALFRVVAKEFGGPDALPDREPHRFGRRLAAAGPGLAGFGALPLHGARERVFVDADPARAQCVLG